MILGGLALLGTEGSVGHHHIFVVHHWVSLEVLADHSRALSLFYLSRPEALVLALSVHYSRTRGSEPRVVSFTARSHVLESIGGLLEEEIFHWLSPADLSLDTVLLLIESHLRSCTCHFVC